MEKKYEKKFRIVLKLQSWRNCYEGYVGYRVIAGVCDRNKSDKGERKSVREK